MTMYFAKFSLAKDPNSNTRRWSNLVNPAEDSGGKWFGQGREEARLAVRAYLMANGWSIELLEHAAVLLIPEHRHHVLPLAPESVKPPPITR